MMYRRRRAAVLGALLVIVILIIVGISRCSSGGDPAPLPSVSASVPSATNSSIPNVDQTPSPTNSTGAIAGVDTGYSGDAAECATAALKVTASTDKDAYAAGVSPQLSMGIQNVGKTACKLNVGTNAQVFQITNKGSLVWQSTDCQTPGVEYWALIQPQEIVKTGTPLVWSREYSSPDTCASTTRVKAPAAGATYYLTTIMGTAKSAQSKAFTLN
jgi:hypothetical protein